MGADHALCEIESRPTDPHSIQLDCFTYEGGLYVQSHRWAQASWWPVKSWAVVWLEHPDVRVRIGDALYDLKATPVAAGPQRDAILGMRGYDPVPDGIVLFRFGACEPRVAAASGRRRPRGGPADLVPLAHGVDQEPARSSPDRLDGQHGLLDLPPFEQVTPKRAGAGARTTHSA